MKKQLTLLLTLLVTLLWSGASARNYNATYFGIEGNGTTMNTRTIQRAIDFIHEEGGGSLTFYVGRYLTGTIELKSNVKIILMEGAILLGSSNPFDYDTVYNRSRTALIKATKAENIGIEGLGVLEGQGKELAYRLTEHIHKGIVKDPHKYDRPAAGRPTLVYFRECKNVKVEGIHLNNAAFWVQIYDQCENMVVNNITVNSTAFWNNDGIDIVDCTNFKLTNSYINAADDAICLKSHSADHACENIEIRNNVARSSASGIKFGTASKGGFKDVKIINNRIYDTYRSAFTIGSVDGSTTENILVDSLYAYNTGNIIYLVVGERNNRADKTSSINNVTIQNVYAEVPATKPDAGYDYEGPIEDLPRNISPSSIVGLPDNYVTNVTLRNVEIVYPGGSNPNYAYRGLKPAELDAIPVEPKRYPEFSQHKELPAWGFYVRYAEGVTFDNVTLTAKEREYRPAVVIQESRDVTLKGMTYNEPGGSKKQLHTYKSENVQR